MAAAQYGGFADAALFPGLPVELRRVSYRPAPPREVARLGAFGELHCPFDRVGKIVVDRLALETAAQSRSVPQ